MKKYSGRIYIGGKVSGLHYPTVYKRFARKESKLKETEGLKVYNPLRYCGERWPWWLCMVVCISILVRCDAIFLLSGWRESRGARIEYKVARFLRLSIYEETTN